MTQYLWTEITALKPQNNGLPYYVKITLTDTAEVPATGTKMVTEKATGQIIITINKQRRND